MVTQDRTINNDDIYIFSKPIINQAETWKWQREFYFYRRSSISTRQQAYVNLVLEHEKSPVLTTFIWAVTELSVILTASASFIKRKYLTYLLHALKSGKLPSKFLVSGCTFHSYLSHLGIERNANPITMLRMSRSIWATYQRNKSKI